MPVELRRSSKSSPTGPRSRRATCSAGSTPRSTRKSALRRRIRVEQHKAEEVQTDTALQSAELALREYRDGLPAHDVTGMQGRIALAEADMKAASNRLAWSERMATKGYASLRQVASDREALLSSTLRLRQGRAGARYLPQVHGPEDHRLAQGRCRKSPQMVHSRGGRL